MNKMFKSKMNLWKKSKNQMRKNLIYWKNMQNQRLI